MRNIAYIRGEKGFNIVVENGKKPFCPHEIVTSFYSQDY